MVDLFCGDISMLIRFRIRPYRLGYFAAENLSRATLYVSTYCQGPGARVGQPEHMQSCCKEKGQPIAHGMPKFPDPRETVVPQGKLASKAFMGPNKAKGAMCVKTQFWTFTGHFGFISGL